MKIKVLLALFLPSILCAMQPPQETIAQLPTYTLISADNVEIPVSGDLVRKFAPGLARKFNIGFTEAQTGKVVIADLDGNALQNFKKLIEETAKLQEANQKKVDTVNKEAKKKIEDIVLPEGQKTRELQERNQVMLQRNLEIPKIADETISQIKTFVEDLPHIGDHFLALFNHTVMWEMPAFLEHGLARFAAEHYGFNIPENYEELTHRDFTAVAQLFYLSEAKLNLNNIVKAYEWLVLLSQNPEITSIEKNKKLFERVLKNIAHTTVSRLREIMNTHPQLRNLWLDPANAQIAQALRKAIIEVGSPAFEKKIMEWPREIYRFDNARIIVKHGRETFVLNVTTNNKVRLNQLHSFGVIDYIPWGPNKVIQLSRGMHGYYVHYYDVNTGNEFPHFLTLEKLQRPPHICVLDDNRFVYSQPTNPQNPQAPDKISLFDDTQDKTRPIIAVIESISDMVALNQHEILIAFRTRLMKFDMSLPENDPKRIKYWGLSFTDIIPIDAITYILMNFDIDNKKNNFIQLLNFQTLELSQKYVEEYFAPRSVFLDRSHVFGEYHDYATIEKVESGQILMDFVNKAIIKKFPSYREIIKLSKNRIVAIRIKGKSVLSVEGGQKMASWTTENPELLLTFIPEMATLAEILDELQAQPLLVEEVGAKRQPPAQSAAPQPKQRVEVQVPLVVPMPKPAAAGVPVPKQQPEKESKSKRAKKEEKEPR